MEQGSNDLTLKLETVNSFLHALGILFGLICMPILLLNASKENNPAFVTGASVYAISFLMVFISSTLYHGFQRPNLKRVLKIVDHISIYFLIAGTYTPMILIFVNNNFGITLLVILWSLTLFGIFFKIFYTGKFEVISTLLYVLMGWILFVDNDTFFAQMPTQIITLVTIGGVLYSIGVIFYLWHRYTYHHVIWHLFVLAAAICHYSAILLAV
jgi:hemolysin III